jgi:phenylacetate-CoA ligase
MPPVIKAARWGLCRGVDAMSFMKPVLTSMFKFAGMVSDYTAWDKYQFLLETQWWPREKLQEYQWRKLTKTLQHAYAEVPLYRKLWQEHGVHPDDIKDRGDMRKIPIVQRADIDMTTCAAQSSRFRKGLQAVQTSGSTGIPFSVLIDIFSYQYKFALWLREIAYTDWEIGKRMASYWHRTYKGYSRQEPHLWIRNTVWSLMGKKTLPPFPTKLSTEPLPDEALAWYKELRDCSPYLLESFDYLVHILASFIVDNSLDPIPVKKLFCLGTPSAHERIKIQKAFPGVDIYNRYGPHEFEGVATDCAEHKGMHISIDSYFVEFVREDGSYADPGEVAHLIITDLDNKAMPLIRYNIRDLARYYDEQCPCGRGLPLMSGLDGREGDYIESADKQKFYFSHLKGFFDRYDEVRWVKVAQSGGGDVAVEIVKECKTDELALARKVAADLKAKIGQEISVRYTDSIQEAHNGKMGFIKRLD